MCQCVLQGYKKCMCFAGFTKSLFKRLCVLQGYRKSLCLRCTWVCFLQGYRKSDEFIVTQYPLESTKEDFWRMVWDRNSPVIIVLQSEEEEVRIQLLESLLTASLTTRQLVLMLDQWGASPLRFNGLKIA